MSVSKLDTFITALELAVVDFGRNDIKLTIGDSINNNRTLTVNQVIRFLTTRRKGSLKLLGKNLLTVYNLVREDIVDLRISNTYRSDAVDINEFFNFVSGLATTRGIGRAVTLQLAA